METTTLLSAHDKHMTNKAGRTELEEKLMRETGRTLDPTRPQEKSQLNALVEEYRQMLSKRGVK